MSEMKNPLDGINGTLDLEEENTDEKYRNRNYPKWNAEKNEIMYISELWDKFTCSNIRWLESLRRRGRKVFEETTV